MKSVRGFHCNKSFDFFCYICGKYTAIAERDKISKKVQSRYKDYFKREMDHLDKCWVPHVVCSTCRTILAKWALKVEGRHFAFKTPMIWRDPVDHQSN